MEQRTIDRLKAEFLEMPGLRLSADQVRRLCGVERDLCVAALDVLVQEKFLCAKHDGTYTRLTEGSVPRPRAAKASLVPLVSSSRRSNSR